MKRTLGIRNEFELYDESFYFLVLGNGWVERLHSGTLWAEGPVYFADGDYLVWSDIPNNRMLRWVNGYVDLFRHPSNNSNGNTRDRQGRLVTCEHGARRVSRTELDGTITEVVGNFGGKRLNSPNDVVVKSDSTIWFTDPPYGILSDYEGKQDTSEYGGAYVFRFDPADGSLAVVANDFDKPNGLAFSPDESKLYVVDTGASHDAKGPHHIRVFDVINGRSLTGGQVFVEVNPGIPDGIRLDVQGNIWSSAGDGVHCYSPSGKLLGKIKIPEPVSNLTFGGPKKNRLFITATSSLYGVYVGTRGAQYP
jgi:gluconolactonase